MAERLSRAWTADEAAERSGPVNGAKYFSPRVRTEF